jgi:hypothetical protein
VAKTAVRLSPRFLAAVKVLGNADLARVELSLQALSEFFGQPHVHAGISIRKLRGNIFECRAGLRIRLLFRATSQGLEVFFVGNHNDVKRLIRNI